MESSNSNSKERELQLTQRLAKQRHSNCMTWVEQLETHLYDLYLLNSPYAVDAFKPAFRSFFGEEHQTFKLKMFHNLDQLRLQLERENLHGVNAKTCLQALRTQFKEFLASKGVNATDLLNQGWQQDFEDFMRYEPSAYRRELLENLDTLEAVIHRVVNTYGVLCMKENEVNALKENGSQQEDKVNMREAVDAGLVVTESSGTKPDKQDTSSSSGNYTTQAVDADIGPVNGTRAICEVLLNSSAGTYVNCKGKTRSLVTKKTDISYVRSSRNSNLMNMLQMMSVHISSGLVLHLDVVWTKQFKASFFILMSLNKTVQTSFLNVKWRLLASLQALFLKVKKGVRLQRKGKCVKAIRWAEENILHMNLQDEMTDILHCLRTVTYWKGKPL
ncbi:hypothetical protein Tco_1539704 [Tanacetum coccineum]